MRPPFIGWTALGIVLAGAADGAAQRADVGNSFRGAEFPAEYVGVMMRCAKGWSPAEREFFRRRVVEAGDYESGRLNTVMELSGEEQRSLERAFPELRGQLSEATPGYLGFHFKKAHLKLAQIPNHFVDQGDRFLVKYSSPARYLAVSDLGRHPGSPLTETQWRHAFRVLRSGALWEERHPECDFGLLSDDGFVKRLQNRFSGLHVRVTPTGIRVGDLWRAVQGHPGFTAASKS